MLPRGGVRGLEVIPTVEEPETKLFAAAVQARASAFESACRFPRSESVRSAKLKATGRDQAMI